MRLEHTQMEHTMQLIGVVDSYVMVVDEVYILKSSLTMPIDSLHTSTS